MPAYGNRDAEWISPLSRYDYPQVIACNRNQCLILPVVVAYDANNVTGLAAGNVLARLTSGVNSGFFQQYKSGTVTASGLGTAVCILLDNVVPASGATVAAAALFKGIAYYSAVSGNTYDSSVLTALSARVVTDATGFALFIF